MTAYTLTFNRTLCQTTTILAKSKQEFLDKAAKLFTAQESQPIETILIDDQLIEVKTEYVVIDDVCEDEE